jgi:hypothetical protein
MIVNANVCDAAVVERVQHELQPLLGLVIPQETRDAVAFQLVYQTTHGDLSLAAEAAEQLVTMDRRAGLPARLCRTLRHQSVPLRLLGRWDEAEEAMREALSISEAYGLKLDILASTHLLANFALDRDDLRAASAWIKRWTELPDAPVTVLSAQSFTVTATRVALGEGRIEDARALFRGIERSLIDDCRARPRNCGLAIALRLRLLEPGEPDPDLVAQLHEGHIRARAWALHDDETEILVRCLQRLNRIAEARTLLSQYINRFRRERWAIPRPLRQLSAALRVTQERIISVAH